MDCKWIRTKSDLWELFDHHAGEIAFILGRESDFALDRVNGKFCIVEYIDNLEGTIASMGRSWLDAFAKWEEFHSANDSIKIGRNYKLTRDQVAKVKELLDAGKKSCHVANRFGVSAGLISQIKNGHYVGDSEGEENQFKPKLSPFNKKVILAMLAKGMKQKELAFYFKVSPSIISMVKTGRM